MADYQEDKPIIYWVKPVYCAFREIFKKWEELKSAKAMEESLHNLYFSVQVNILNNRFLDCYVQKKNSKYVY